MDLISAANKFSDNNLQCSVHVLFLTISMEESPEIGIGLGVVYFRLFYCNLLVKSRLNEDAGVPSINFFGTTLEHKSLDKNTLPGSQQGSQQKTVQMHKSQTRMPNERKGVLRKEPSHSAYPRPQGPSIRSGVLRHVEVKHSGIAA